MKTIKVSESDFDEKAKLFKEAIMKLQKKFGLKLTAGYINTWDDEGNIIIVEEKNDEVIHEVYFDTLSRFL